MTYRTPESLIRSIMNGALNESVASDNMNPALKTDDSARLTGAVEVLKASGVSSAEIKDNAISVSPAETMQAANILDAAFTHGLITVKPQLTSPNAIPMPEPHVQEPTFAKEETVEEGSTNINMKLPDQKDAEDQTPQGKVGNGVNVELEPRSLRNRTENQVKKVDEESVEEAHTYDQAKAKFDKHNAAELEGMVKHDRMKAAGKIDLKAIAKNAHKTKRHGQAMDAAYKVMNKSPDSPMNKTMKEELVVEGEEHSHITDKHIIDHVNSSKGKVSAADIARKHGAKYTTKFDNRVHALSEKGHFQKHYYNGGINYSKNKNVKEDVEQIDEISKKAAGQYIKTASNTMRDHEIDRQNSTHGMAKVRDDHSSHGNAEYKRHANTLAKADKGISKRWKGINNATNKLTGSAKVNATEEVLHELSYSRLKSYEKKGTEQVADAAKKNKLDARIAKRAAYVAKAKEKSTAQLKKAAFGEEANPLAKIVSICEGLRKVETLHSECGKHHAKIYKDTEWGEHTVKYHINGKHHEPADSHHGDHDDAHHTAKAELKRMTKLNGALKESTEEEVNELLEDFEQIDELSKALLGRYVTLAARSKHNLGHEAANDPAKSRGHAFKKSTKRTEHIATAVSKITGQGKMHAQGLDHVFPHANDKPKVRATEEVEPIVEGKQKLEDYKRKHVQGLYSYHHFENPKNGHFIQVHVKNKKDIVHGDRSGNPHKKFTNLADLKKHVESLDEEVAKEGDTPFQIDEISKETLKRYIPKAEASRDKHFDLHSVHQDAARKMSDPDAKANAYKKAHAHFDKGASRDAGVEKAKARLKEDIEQIDEITKIGTYSNRFGHTLTMHRSPNDPKHHMLVHDGSVVKTHYGSAHDFHKELSKDGFHGELHEEQINELSKSCLSNYVIKAGASASHHSNEARKGFAKANAPRNNDEPEVRSKMHKSAQGHALKAMNRRTGISTATQKMNNSPKAKVHATEEVEQIDELSNKTLNSYVSKSASSMVSHITKNPSAKLDNDKHLQKRHAGYQLAKKKIAARKPEQSFPGAIDGTRLKEEVELTEGKKEDVEKAKKHLFKHPEVDAIGKTMMTATKNFNYVQDACDHVYNNHSKDLSYEDFDKIRPHLEDHFKKSGLK